MCVGGYMSSEGEFWLFVVFVVVCGVWDDWVRVGCVWIKVLGC